MEVASWAEIVTFPVESAVVVVLKTLASTVFVRTLIVTVPAPA